MVGQGRTNVSPSESIQAGSRSAVERCRKMFITCWVCGPGASQVWSSQVATPCTSRSEEVMNTSSALFALSGRMSSSLMLSHHSNKRARVIPASGPALSGGVIMPPNQKLSDSEIALGRYGTLPAPETKETTE